MKKEILQLNQDVDFYLIGLVSKLSPVKLVWSLNQKNNFNFWSKEEIYLSVNEKQESLNITNFESIDEENHLKWSLLYNRDIQVVFLKQLRQFDYLLIVSGGTEFLMMKDVLSEIRSIAGVYAVSFIENPKIKEKLSWLI